MNAHDEDLDLHRTTLQVYRWLITQSEGRTRREVRDGAQLSSVSLASYHLKKLESLGLVTENQLGRYSVVRLMPLGELRFYLLLGNRLVPRFVLYFSFYGTFLLLYLLFMMPYVPIDFTALMAVLALFGVITSAIEIYILLRSKVGGI